LYALKQNYDNAEKILFDFELDLEWEDWVSGRDAAATLGDGRVFFDSEV
jgi:hypothetical protein